MNPTSALNTYLLRFSVAKIKQKHLEGITIKISISDSQTKKGLSAAAFLKNALKQKHYICILTTRVLLTDT